MMETVDSQYIKEAYDYIITEHGVQCMLCPHTCNLKEGESGLCKSRTNRSNRLYTEVYGRACALHIDPIEKKPLYHFLPGSKCLSVATTGCNLACANCQNSDISQAKPSAVKALFLPPEKLVTACLDSQCESIAYTYTEPLTYYEYTLDSAQVARQHGVKNVLISAGYINPTPLDRLCKWIDAANIDLKSFDNGLYKRLNHATLQPVLDTLLMLKEKGVWLEITNLLIPGLNDSDSQLESMCTWLVENGFADTPIHFSRFYPTYKLTTPPPTPLNCLLRAREIAKNTGVKYIYLGNASESDGEVTYCPECHKLLIDRSGYKITQNNLAVDQCKVCHTPLAGRF